MKPRSAIYRRTKRSVGYHITEGRDRCGVCEHFLAPHRCEKVSGAVQANGWCELFRRAAEAALTARAPAAKRRPRD